MIAAALVAGAAQFAYLWSRQNNLASPWSVVLGLAVGTVGIIWGPAGLQRARQTLLPPPVPAAGPAPTTLPKHELLYLGQADSILALYDVRTGRPIRLPSSNVVLVELTAAERATTTLRTCPRAAR